MAAEDIPPSKTRRKAAMHALQDLGEALVGLDPKRFAMLADEAALPPRLVDAILEARSITAWGARKRQLQYVGRLMRDVDPEPIRRRLELWAHGHAVDSAHQHALEQWRDRLIAEPAALDLLAAARPRLDRPRFRALIARARDEQARGQPPHAFRELFRELKALDPEPG
ncbi:MAG: ribosome biogenesis factor YjgA [Casimicrobiaceae bacterium]